MQQKHQSRPIGGQQQRLRSAAHRNLQTQTLCARTQVQGPSMQSNGPALTAIAHPVEPLRVLSLPPLSLSLSLSDVCAVGGRWHASWAYLQPALLRSPTACCCPSHGKAGERASPPTCRTPIAPVNAKDRRAFSVALAACGLRLALSHKHKHKHKHVASSSRLCSSGPSGLTWRPAHVKLLSTPECLEINAGRGTAICTERLAPSWSGHHLLASRK